VKTLIAVAVAVGVMSPPPAPPPPQQPKVACEAGWRRTADGCVRDKAKGQTRGEWQIAF
jgi:hypothetical protein